MPTASLFPSFELDLSTELFFNQLPAFLFIITGVCRYISLSRIQTSERTATEDEDDEDSSSEETFGPTPALKIKVKLSYFMAFVYFLAVPLAFSLPNQLFLSAEASIQSLWYLTGMLAWILSGLLIELEFEKEYAQELYTHQLFFPLTMLVSVLNIFLKENFLVDLILHGIKIFLAFVLTVYVLVKPNDRLVWSPRSDNFGSPELKDETGNKWLLLLLNRLERTRIMQFLFRYNLEIRGPESIRLIELTNNNKKKTSFSDSLIRDNSYISQPLIARIPENRLITVETINFESDASIECLNPQFLITTRLNEKTFESKRRLHELLDFSAFISSIYKEDHGFDEELVEQFPEYKGSGQPKDIELFLNLLISEPAFTHPRLLDFLRVNSFIDRKPFVEFFNSIVPKKSLIIMNNNRIDSGYTLSPGIRRNSENNIEFRDNEDGVPVISFLNLNSQKLIGFEIQSSGWEKAKDHYLFIFQVRCLTSGIAWTIKKSYSDIKDFNKNLLESSKKNYNLFNSLVPKKTMNYSEIDSVFLEQRRQGLEHYLREVLNDRSFYEELLFNFIGFDAERRMPLDIKDELDYSMSEDEINVNKLDFVENVSSPQFLKLKEDNLVDLEERKGKWGIIKSNELCSPSLKGKRKVVSDINFNNVRIVFNGIKTTLMFQNQNSNRFQGKRSNTIQTGKMERNYFINLEETEGSSPHFVNIRTVIKLSKNYKELEEFDRIIRKNFENDYLPELPEDIEESNEQKRRKLWESYFHGLINIRMIEENQNFKDFFHLDRARNKYMYDSEKKETFKLDLTNC